MFIIIVALKKINYNFNKKNNQKEKKNNQKDKKIIK